MDIQELKCKNCGSPVQYQPGATYIKCGYCGTEYILAPAASKQGYESVKQIDYSGRGMMFQSFVPQGWNARIISDDESTSIYAGICKGLRLDSPQGAQLLFYPFAYFRNFSPGPLGLMKDYFLEPNTCVRFRRRQEPEQYVTQRLKELFGAVEDLRLTQTEDRDGVLSRRAAAFATDASKVLKGKLTAESARYSLRFSIGGAEYSGCFGTGMVYVQQPPKQEQPPEQKQPPKQEQPAGRGGGLLSKALNYKGLLGGPSVNDMLHGSMGTLHTGQAGKLMEGLGGLFTSEHWARVFDFILLCPGGDWESLEGCFDDFCRCLDYGGLYYALQDEEVAKVRQIQIQGAMQRQRIAMNAQRELHRTQSETSDIINSGYWDRSRRMDAVGERYSEAVRGVNSYDDLYGRKVEADVAYEHVYQRGDSFAGSKEKGAEPPLEWQELKRR